MVYLDNASTTLIKPKCVKKVVKKGLNIFTANASRSGHSYSTKTGLEIVKVRECFAKIFNCSSERVLFTSGCTESLNLAIRGSCRVGGHIILTCYEHNSVLRVVEYLRNNYNVSYSVIYPNSQGKISAEEIEKKIRNNTYLLIVNHTSNVTGTTQDLLELGKVAKKHKLLFLVDGAQSVGHLKIDMQKCNISFLAVAGHKGLMGIQGVGALCVSDNASLEPIKFGGTGTFSESLAQPKDFPEGFESGTFSAINIIAMGEGLKFSYDNLILKNNKILKLEQKIIQKLKSYEQVKLYSKNKNNRGVVSFNIKNISPQEVAAILNNDYGIAVRAGLACAPYVHKFLGTDKDGGVVRVSLGIFNTNRDVKLFLKAIDKIIKKSHN